MDNTVNNISHNFYQTRTQDQVQKDIQKTSDGKTEKQKQANTNAPEAGNGQTDKVEISSRRSENVEPNHAVPEGRDEAVELLEDTKRRIDKEIAIQSQNLEQIHNLNPGDLIEILS